MNDLLYDGSFVMVITVGEKGKTYHVDPNCPALQRSNPFVLWQRLFRNVTDQNPCKRCTEIP